MDLLILAGIIFATFNVVSSVNPPPYKELNDGNKMPALAIGSAGTAKYKKKMRDIVNWAVEAGHRHIDTASVYENEAVIGEGIADVIKKGIVKREDLFITTKLWNDKHRRDQVVPALREALKQFNLDYIDLYLVHFPVPEKCDGSLDDVDYLETWKGMEDAKKLGLTKSIGVSNFNAEQIDRIIANSDIKPAVNQIEVNPTLTQVDLVKHCLDLGIQVMAYSPFGFVLSKDPRYPPPKIDDPTLTAIAKKYGKTTTQVVLRYLIDRGMVPIPKSKNASRLAQNLDVFDFKLTPEEVTQIDNFNKDLRVIDNPLWRFSAYYPFANKNKGPGAFFGFR